jgi:flagellar biosynthesis anti-sigma factor FlgM
MDVFLYKVGQGFPTAAAKKNQNAGVSPQPAQANAAAGPSLRFADLRESLASAPVIDESKVAKVSGALQAGRYEVDSRQAAAKLLELERRLP